MSRLVTKKISPETLRYPLLLAVAPELPLEFPDGTTPVTCRVSVYDNSSDSKVGVGSMMDKALAPPLPSDSLYMEELHVKVHNVILIFFLFFICSYMMVIISYSLNFCWCSV